MRRRATDATRQQRNPALRCARTQHDDVLSIDIERVWQANLQIYGAEKVWRRLRREGTDVARCMVERLNAQGRPAWRRARREQLDANRFRHGVSIKHSERLAKAGIEPSMGSKGIATTTPWPRPLMDSTSVVSGDGTRSTPFDRDENRSATCAIRSLNAPDNEAHRSPSEALSCVASVTGDARQQWLDELPFLVTHIIG